MSRSNHAGNNNINTLKILFFIHFVIDVLIAIPLFIIPEVFLKALGWQVIDPVAARLVAAALFGIGIESLFIKNSGLESFGGMLNLKIIWSGAAMVGIGISIFQNAQNNQMFLWMTLLIFLIFNLIWIYWKVRLNSMTKDRTPLSNGSQRRKKR